MKNINCTHTNTEMKFETFEEEIEFFDNQYTASMLDHLEDLLDGFQDDREEEKKQYSIYFRPEETKALKYLALELGDSVSLSKIIQKAVDTYDYTKEEIEHYKPQKDREGSNMSSIHLSTKTRERHKQIASSIGLTGNQFYRMCINGILKQERIRFQQTIKIENLSDDNSEVRWSKI